VSNWRYVRWTLTCAVCGAAPVALAQTAVPNLNGYVTLSTAYWKRGLAQDDGASARLGVDFEHHTGLYVGAWAQNVDFAYEYSATQPRDIEADVYAGYHQRRELWSWNLGLGRYVYPGTAIDYDYNELSATFGFRDRLFYTAAYSDSYYARGHSSLNQEVSIAFPLRGNFEIGAALGKFAIADGVLDVTHWNVGVSKLVHRLSFDLRYYDGNYASPSYFGDPDAHHYVLSISYALRGARPRI
jgi:uncharacterized protein (TIGR02001 family)